MPYGICRASSFGPDRPPRGKPWFNKTFRYPPLVFGSEASPIFKGGVTTANGLVHGGRKHATYPSIHLVLCGPMPVMQSGRALDESPSKQSSLV